MLRCLLLTICTIVCLHAADDARTRALAVATAHGSEQWNAVQTLRFTWTHHPSGKVRSYVWDRTTDNVTVTIGDTVTTVPAAGGELDENQRNAHKAFINDSYWFLFELHLAWDNVTFELLPATELAELDGAGMLTPLRVTYPSAGGYTPGDAYVLYLTDSNDVAAWAFHPGDAATPKIITTRADEWQGHGLTLPTRFVRVGGDPFISITAISAE